MTQPQRRRESDLLLAAAIVACLLLGWWSRRELSPDGVSYLDLAGAIQRGNWAQLVQGYWSPFYPVVIAAIGSAAHARGAALIPIAHAINVAAVMLAAWVLWSWARGRQAMFMRATFAALFLCSWGPPRIEAVTPDVLLLALLVLASRWLIDPGSRRWCLIGITLGLAFLVKTSTWPWLLIALPVRWVMAADRSARWRVVWSTLLSGAVAAVWIVPLSIRSGHLTAGSAARLNYAWYLRATGSRLPDTDPGRHASYQSVSAGPGQTITVAVFDDADRWTYQPWGDPTAWAEGVEGDTGRTPSVSELIRFWLRSAGLVVGVWLLPLIMGVMVPAWALTIRRGVPRPLLSWRARADGAGTLMMLGLAGVAQFVAVHPEPRLIAPFAMMFALGGIAWCDAPIGTGPAITPRWLRLVLPCLGVAVAAVFLVRKLVVSERADRLLATRDGRLATIWERVPGGGDGRRIAIIGPAGPVLATAYRVGAHIVMQVPPGSVQRATTVAPAGLKGLVAILQRGNVAMIWQTREDGDFRLLQVPTVAP